MSYFYLIPAVIICLYSIFGFIYDIIINKEIELIYIWTFILGLVPVLNIIFLLMYLAQFDYKKIKL